MHQITLH